MKFGTIAYDGEIYNLDYMSSEEVKNLLDKVEAEKNKDFCEQKNEVK